MLIGITGKNCAGKDTVADYLKSKGFESLSLSDEIRHELKARGLENTRENLISTANDLRQNFGSNELAKRTAKKILPGKNYTIVSIRNPEEVRELAALEGFFMINVSADENTRFERMSSRAREGDPKTFEDFCKAEEAEAKNENPASQQLDVVCKMAEFEVQNNSDLTALQEKIDSILRKKVKK